MSPWHSNWLARTLAGLLACAAVVAANRVRAQVPLRMPVHAELFDESGRAVNGELQIVFAIYAGAKGGTALYRETRTARVEGGQLDVLLGEVVALDPQLFASHGELYLGITVEQDDEATPRLQLGSVPFALSAEHAHDATTLVGLGEDELQRRVVGSCAGGEVLVAIEANGSVRCEPLPDTTRGPKGADGAPGPVGPRGERGEPGPIMSFDCEGQAVSALDQLGRPTCTPLVDVNVRAGAGLAIDDCAGGTCELGVAPESLGMAEVSLPMSGKFVRHPQLLRDSVLYDDGQDFIPTHDGQCLVLVSLEIAADGQARNPSSGRLGMRVGYREGDAREVKFNSLEAFANLPTDGKPVASTVQHSVISVKAGLRYRFGCYLAGLGDWAGVPLFCQVSKLCQ
jgi:hypothetical protein